LVLAVLNIWIRLLLCSQHLYWLILQRCKYLDYIASNCRITDDGRIGKHLKGSGHGLVEVLFLHLSGGTEEDHAKLSHCNWLPDQNENLAPHETNTSGI
jgi:hypothetical protein